MMLSWGILPQGYYRRGRLPNLFWKGVRKEDNYCPNTPWNEVR
jgi:hypothetical protein